MVRRRYCGQGEHIEIGGFQLTDHVPGIKSTGEV
jgi:hypothetical protein